MIQSKNVDKDAAFAKEAVVLGINAGASLVGVIQSGFRVPYAGKVVSAHVYAATITDADDSVRVDLQKNGVSMLGATIDPVAAGTTTSLNPTVGLTVAAGDVIDVRATTGIGDALVGNVTIVIRPLLGEERALLARE